MTSIGLVVAWTQLVTSQTALDHLECFRWSIFPLNQDKRLLLKEKSASFKICFGLELKKRVDECFCENNLHLEWGKKDHSGTILWHVVPGVIDSPLLIRKDCSLTQRDAESAESAENVSANSQQKDCSLTQRDAESAESAENTSTNSHRENRNFYQENIYYKDQWHRYQRSQQNQEQEVPQTSLGRGLISIENGAEGSIGFSASSALLPPPAPLSLSSYQRNEQLLLLFKV